MHIFWKYVSILCWISYILIASILLFSRGFLLSRHVISSHSICSHESLVDNSDILFKSYMQGHNFSNVNRLKQLVQSCPSSDFKVVLVVIDALRYDFVSQQNSSKIYHNKFTFIHEMMQNEKKNRLYRFIADPPTTTMQRLHGLMTGSLPTFIDIGSNFASSEIIEDNLLYQLILRNKKTVFLGDDTWNNLFPKFFHRSFPFSSFNVWDLDTVDNGINEKIYEEIRKTDWDLLIAHFLGVDHCGHRYGPNHPEMGRKLTEMNSMVKNVVNILDNSTFLFILGDHGMTESGDHGGSSDDEVTAALFLHSPVDLISEGKSSTIRQIDLLPTLSTILGVAIPFSNLGSIIIDSLPSYETNSSLTPNIRSIFKLLWRNIEQITYYIKEYSLYKSHFPVPTLNEVTKQYEILSSKYMSKHGMPSLLEDSKIYLKNIQVMCDNVWTQFDNKAISCGLILFFSSLLCIYFSVFKITDDLDKIISKCNIILLLSFILVFSFIITLILQFLNFIDSELMFYFFTVITSLPVFLFNKLTSGKYNLDSDFKISVFCTILCSLLTLGLFSNSYIISESNLVSFLLLTVIWISLLRILVLRKKVSENSLKENYKFILFKKFFLFFVCICLSFIIRGLQYFWQCYDVQAGKCYTFKMNSHYSNFVSIVSFIFLKKVSFRVIDILGIKLGTSLSAFYCQNIPKVCFFLLSISWTLICLHSSLLNIFSVRFIHLIPLFVCLFSIIGVIWIFIFPLSVFYTSHNLIIHRFDMQKNCMGNIMLRKKSKDNWINNIESIYSGIFILLTIFLSIFGIILFGAQRSLSIVLMFLSLAGLLLLLSILKLIQIKSVDCLFIVSWWEVIAWQLSSLVHFFGTGHQAIFSSLHWDSVTVFNDFVPLFIPGILIVFNTYISQILHALLLPLVFITPLTIGRVFLKGSSIEEGEFLLFKKKKFRRQCILSLVLRYIIVSGIRVFCIMLSSAIHSRHLMVWAIFAPKFIFEGIGFMVSLPSAILGFVLVERISQQIQYFIKKKNFEVVFQ